MKMRAFDIAHAATPTGLDIKAQGCAYPRYPGITSVININPNGVAHYFSANTTPACCLYDSFLTMCNPVGVVQFFSRFPRVARIRATLGFDVKPLWGCKRSAGIPARLAHTFCECGQECPRSRKVAIRATLGFDVQPRWGCGARRCTQD